MQLGIFRIIVTHIFEGDARRGQLLLFQITARRGTREIVGRADLLQDAQQPVGLCALRRERRRAEKLRVAMPSSRASATVKSQVKSASFASSRA